MSACLAAIPAEPSMVPLQGEGSQSILVLLRTQGDPKAFTAFSLKEKLES